VRAPHRIHGQVQARHPHVQADGSIVIVARATRVAKRARLVADGSTDGLHECGVPGGAQGGWRWEDGRALLAKAVRTQSV